MNTQEQAKQWVDISLHFSPEMNSKIHAYIDEMPLTLVGMPHCPACESVLCGVCGDCHSWDLYVSDPPCPNDPDTTGGDCVAWWQALKAMHTVQRMNDEE